MAIYVSSDIHGYPLSRFLQMLDFAGFGKDDKLYILGDVIDRNGDGGVEMLRWIVREPRVTLIRGNHEQMMLDSEWVFATVDEENVEGVTDAGIEAVTLWQFNGGDVTMSTMQKLLHEDSGAVAEILDYLKKTPLCQVVEAGDNTFVLCHAGFKDFDDEKKLSDYSTHDLLWNRPDPEDEYFLDAITVIGHTPTVYFGKEGRAYNTATWIDIDVGGAMGKPPMLLRLDDLRAFYFD